MKFNNCLEEFIKPITITFFVFWALVWLSTRKRETFNSLRESSSWTCIDSGELEVCKIYVIGNFSSISALFPAGGIESSKWDWPDRFFKRWSTSMKSWSYISWLFRSSSMPVRWRNSLIPAVLRETQDLNVIKPRKLSNSPEAVCELGSIFIAASLFPSSSYYNQFTYMCHWS